MSADLVAILSGTLLFIAGYAIYLRMRSGKRRKLYSGRMNEMISIKDGNRSNESAVDVNDLFRQFEGDREPGLAGQIKRTINDALRPVGGLPALRFVLLMSASAGAVGALVGAKVLGLPTLFNVVVGIFLALFVPYSYIKNKAQQRRDNFLDAFPGRDRSRCAGHPGGHPDFGVDCNGGP